MKKNKPNISNKSVACKGATAAVAATFVYAVIVMIYVIIRTSATIYRIMPAGERSEILWLNGFSIAYSVAVFSMLMAMVSALIGAIGAIVLWNLLLYFNPKFNLQKTVLLSFAAALSLVTVIYILLRAMLKDWMTVQYHETFIFWFIIPAVICIAVGLIGGIILNKALSILHTANCITET